MSVGLDVGALDGAVESSLVFDELRRAKEPFGELHSFVFSHEQTLNSFRIK